MAIRYSPLRKSVEVWNTRQGTIVKIAVRQTNGQFHGATNVPLSGRNNLRVGWPKA